MTLLDILLLIPIAWFTLRGWRHGLVREVTTLLGILVGIWAAVHLSQQVIEWLSLEGESAVLIAFFVCFVGALVLAYLLGTMIEGLLKATKISVANRVAGAASGLLKAVCILAVILGYIVMIDKNEAVITASVKEQSTLYKPVYYTGSKLTASLKQYIADHKDGIKEALS